MRLLNMFKKFISFARFAYDATTGGVNNQVPQVVVSQPKNEWYASKVKGGKKW